MMALQSGLLNESTSTVGIRLLEVLVDHYRRCLNLIFHLVDDYEVGFMFNPGEEVNLKWFELECDIIGVILDVNTLSCDKTIILDSTNYTYKKRCKKIVRTREEEAPFLYKRNKKWADGKIKSKSSDSSNVCKKECGPDTEDESFLCSCSQSMGPLNSDSDAIMENCDESSLENNKTADLPTNLSKEKQDTPSDKKEKIDSSESATKCNVENNSNGVEKIRPMTSKRRALKDLDNVSYNCDEPILCTTSDAQDSLACCCICISYILRNLSFVPGNDTEMSKHSGFLRVMGRLLLLHHVHSPLKPPQRHYDREKDGTSVADSCGSLNSEHEWWWEMLHIVRGNTLITLANIAGQLDLAPFPEEISSPILDGLMHWVICPSSHAQEPLPTQSSRSVPSPQCLSLEVLCRLSILKSNVGLMMATPHCQWIDRFFALLSKWLSWDEVHRVLRESAVVLLSNLSKADSIMARVIALQGTFIPRLIAFVEQVEQNVLHVCTSEGFSALIKNPELMGTTLDIVRRAARILRCLARIPCNRTLFLPYQQRLLELATSQVLDNEVGRTIQDMLFECSQEDTEDLSNLTDSEKKTVSLIESLLR